MKVSVANVVEVGLRGGNRNEALVIADSEIHPIPVRAVLRIVKNIISQVGSNLVAQGLAFLSTAYVARLLQAEGFGWIGFAQGFLTYFTLITDLGLRAVGMREVAKHHGDVPKWVGHILGLRLALASISMVVFLGTVVLLPKPAPFKWFLVGYGFVIYTSALLLDWAFQGLERMELVALGEVLRAGCYLALVFGGFHYRSQIFRIPVFTVLSQLLPVGLLFGIFWRKFRRIRPTADLGFWKDLLGQSLPICVGALVLQLASGLDVILLGFLRSESEVGYYSAAFRLAFLPSSVTGVVGFSMFPVMARYWKDQPAKLGLVTQHLGRVLVLMGLPIVTAGWLFAPSFLSFVYGPGFLPAVLSFRILLGYLLVAHIYCPFYYLLQACGKARAYMKGMMAGAVVGAMANLILIPFYGAPGAAIAKVLAHLLILLTMYRSTRREIVSVPLAMDLLRCALLVVPMGVLMAITPGVWLVRLAVGLTAYLGLLAISQRKLWTEFCHEMAVQQSLAQE